MVTRGERFSAWGHEYTATFTYLDRGYQVHCANGRTRAASPISHADRPERERQVRAYKEELSRIHNEDAASAVIALLGPPDIVTIYTHREWNMLEREGDYRGEFESAPPPVRAYGVWREKYCLVRFTDNRVTSTSPLWASLYEYHFHTRPPHLQRDQ